MAINKTSWLNAKQMFEAGLSLSIISEETNISKSQISKISKKESWEKGSKQYISTKVILVPISGILYVIQAGNSDYYKIGITMGSVSQRLNELQTGNHLKLSVKFTKYEENVREKERILHEKYRQYNSQGEWFKLENTIFESILKDLISG